jgi:rhamnogalacturonyl hydrolase YesR
MTNQQTAAALREVRQSLEAVQNWVESHGYRGYEPFDGLSSWARPLMLGNEFAERLLMQLIRQCPINLRPLLGISPKDSTKGQGYMAWGYLLLYRTTRKQEYLDKATRCLEWLDQHKAPRFQKHSWSNHFDFVSRGGGYTKNDPIIVWTALIAHAYVEAYEATKRDWFLKIAESACDWILDLPREKTQSGTCLSYIDSHQSSIHNSNMLGAAILARTARHNGNQEYQRVAREAMVYSCTRQLPSGAWWYGEEPKYHWIDNFHTGYNLDSLKFYVDSSGDEEYRDQLEKGLSFYKRNFFEADGCPKYYHSRTYPIDIQCAGQSIDTLAKFSEVDAESLELASRVASWTIHNLQDRRGYFYYRKYPVMTAKTPMLHWGQGTMFKGLAGLFQKLSGRPESAGAVKGESLSSQ